MLQIKRYNKTRQTDEAVLSLQDIPEGAIVHRELMGDHYIKLPFSYDEPVYLNVGDWCEIVGYGRFELTEPYSPKYNTETGGYDYELQLNAHYKKWKNKICKYMPSSGGKETSFDLTASLGVHLAVIIENITTLGAKDSSFKYRVDENTLVNFSADIDAAHVDSTAAKHKRYENTDIISALDDLADIYDCEWWVDDNIIRFGRLEIEGEPTPFNVDVEDANAENNVSSISSTESKKEYANRLYVFGSDRNIPKNYRPVQGADITVNGVVQKRLMLPEELPEELPEGFEVPEGVILGSGYIQDGELEESEVVEAVMVDDDIYPRTNCHISRIETYTKTYTDEETNRQVTQTFYRLYDDSGFRFSNSIRLEREELRILFVSGSMNGMDFECIYNDKNKYYEVVVNDDYGRELPDTDLHPSVGDCFVIYGWDSTKMASTGLIADAELELYQSAVKKLAKLKIDPNVYTCKMDSEWYERERRVSGVSYAHFDLGQKVLLNSRAVSVEGRESRIIGFEFKLDIPYDSPEYIVGEATAYSRSSDMQSQIDAITFNGSSYHVTGGGGGSSIFVISSTSKVQSSDTNVYSAKRTDFDFLHKREPDEAKEEIGFVKGLWVKMKGLFAFTENGDLTARTITATGTKGNTIADIDNTTRKNLGLEVSESGIIGGILRVAKSILTKTIQSMNFTGGDSMFGTGWQLTDNDGNGNSRLVVDNLIVRMKAVFNELEVRKFVAMAGNYVFSPAASIIEEVDYIGLDENDNEVVLGYEYVKVPWVLRLVPLSLIGKILSKKKMVRSTMSSSDFANVVKFRCWLRSDDGTTRTINTWRVGMLARCQTFNVSQGSGTHEDTWYGKNISNKLYWRAVTAVGEAVTSQSYSMPNHILDDGLKHNYIDLANYTDDNDVQLYLTGSDNPEALDNIVCYGDWLDRTLSNLISIETVGSEAPCIREMLEVGYTNGQSIDWSLTNKERTRISPTAGNKFVAPSFVVTTEGSADESLYVERYKGTAFKTQFVQGLEVAMAPDGSIVLLAYSDIEAQNALKTLHINPPSVDYPAYGFVWKSSKARLGDAYVCQADGHRYVATKTGWEDRGLNDESSSTLKVDINGITSRVSSAEGNISQLQQTAAGLVSMVSQNTVARNILNGVLTGTGWKSGVWNNGTFTPSGDITVDQDGWFAKNAQEDNCFALEGVSLAAESYMLSLCSAAVSDTGTPADDYPSITCYLKKSSDQITITTNSGAERRECTTSIPITQALSGNYTLYVVSPKIRFPQLEKGTTVTDFDAPVLEQTTSLISQMADSISMSIVNKLGETGINIDGNNRSIELRGDIVTFTNSDGSVSGMVTIDPDTGALHATNAVVTGLSATNATITGLTATNAVVSGSFSTEQGYNKVIIDAATGGLEMYGPDTLENGTERALTLRMGWGLSDLSDGTCGIIEVFEAQHQNISTTIVPGEIDIKGPNNVRAIIDYNGLNCTSGQMTFEELIGRCLSVAYVSSDWYDAKMSDSMIVSDYNGGITINLPYPGTSPGKFFFIKHKKDKATYLRCTTAEERGYNAIMNDDSESTDWQRNIQNNSTLVFCDGYNWILMELDY